MSVILKVKHLGDTWKHAGKIFISYDSGMSKKLL